MYATNILVKDVYQDSCVSENVIYQIKLVSSRVLLGLVVRGHLLFMGMFTPWQIQ